jgi:putative transposase
MPLIERPPFVAFDEQKPVRIYSRNLPHWRQAGCTYFVTFRLNDSIPDAVRAKWEEEQALWLKARGIEYDGAEGTWRLAFERLPKADQFRFHQHFNRQVQSCLDRGHGACWLARHECIEIVRRWILENDGKSHHVGDFIIMPNHVHLLDVPTPLQELERILKGIKGASAVYCNRALGRDGPFWQADSYDHIVRDLEQLAWFREYIALNPAKAHITVPALAHYRASWMDAWFARTE